MGSRYARDSGAHCTTCVTLHCTIYADRLSSLSSFSLLSVCQCADVAFPSLVGTNNQAKAGVSHSPAHGKKGLKVVGGMVMAGVKAGVKTDPAAAAAAAAAAADQDGESDGESIDLDAEVCLLLCPAACLLWCPSCADPPAVLCCLPDGT